MYLTTWCFQHREANTALDLEIKLNQECQVKKIRAYARLRSKTEAQVNAVKEEYSKKKDEISKDLSSAKNSEADTRLKLETAHSEIARLEKELATVKGELSTSHNMYTPC